MADELNKDIVAAKISLDTSNIKPELQTLDQGIRQNAETFKVLNAELTVAEKGYASLAKSMDKVALSSEERRKKTMDESNALVASRTAQADLYKAKTQQLDITNQLVDSKLTTQKTIQKQREDAIEQQEQQHQQRMITLQQKSSLAGAQENLLKVSIDRKLQLTEQGNRRLEMAEESHAARMSRLSSGNVVDNSSSFLSGIGDKIQTAAMHAAVFHGVYSAINETQQLLKVGLVDIESNMAGYVQTNEKYFMDYNAGTQEMTMNTKKLHDETTQFLQTTHDLGAQITDVTESARLWGRMYKDAGVVQELVRQSTKLSTVDLVDLQDATKGMESVMAQYGVQIRNSNDAMVVGNRILDSWSKVAHDTMAPAADLAAAFERTGKIADEVGVSFDFMNGLMSSGIRNTALGGANLGNMWKTVLGNIRSDKAVKEIESLGVATKEVVNGTEQWRKAEDIILELSTKVVDKNYDLTKSFEDISRGIYQYAKLAASLNPGDILLGTAASIGSTGSTMEYLQVQMDTIQRKAAQTKASLLEIFNQAGDDGLRSSIKGVLDVLDQLLIGFTKIPTGVYEGTAALGGLLLAYKVLKDPIMNLKTAVGVLTAAKTAETAATTINTTANEVNIVSAEGVTLSTVARTVATESGVVAEGALTVATETATVAMTAEAAVMTVVTGGLVLLGAVLAGVVYAMGTAEKASRDNVQTLKDQDSAAQQMISQYQRQIDLVPKLASAHNSLQGSIDKGTLSTEQHAKVVKQLDEVNQALSITLGQVGADQLKNANYTDAAVQQQIESLKSLIEEQNKARTNSLHDQQSQLESDIEKKKKELDAANNKLTGALVMSAGETGNTDFGQRMLANLEKQKKAVSGVATEYDKLVEQLTGVKVQIGELAVAQAQQLSGSSGKATQDAKTFAAQLAEVQKKLKDAESAISDMNQASADMAAGHSLNAQKVSELISKYPELEGHIKKTKDGWIIEKSAIDSVKQAHVDLAVKMQSSQTAMNGAAFTGMDARIAMYGIELLAITDLKTAMDEANKVPDTTGLANRIADPERQLTGIKLGMGETSAENEKLRAAIIAMGKAREDAKKLYQGLYSDNSFGVSSGGGSGSKKSDDPLQKAFDEFRKRLDHLRTIGKLTNEQEIKEWKDVQSKFSVRTDLRWQVEEKLFDLQKKLGDDKAKLEKQSLQDSEGWIAHKKAIGELSAQEELTAWERVQKRYLKGTEERKKADEQVYAAKQALVQADEKKLDDMMNKEKTYLEQAKQAELDKIDAEKQKYVDAQDAKIKKLDELMQAEDQANSDQDYAGKLKEKQDRLAVLQSAVGPDGIKERKQVILDIADLEQAHQRDLTKRANEAEKQRLQDDKTAKEKDFDKQKTDAENHYKDLLGAFDNFSNDQAGRAETLKQIQIAKDKEKNTEILKNLDTFVTDYQTKMASIAGLSKTQAETDFDKYTENQRVFNDPKSTAAQKKAANQENVAFRNQYGISQTNYAGIQHFGDGGVVQGRRGEPVPTISHAGEMYLNDKQQSNLFRLLDFKMPQINFSMPGFNMPNTSTTIQNFNQQFDMSADQVNLHDSTDIRTFFNERDSMVRRVQSRSGAKQRF